MNTIVIWLKRGSLNLAICCALVLHSCSKESEKQVAAPPTIQVIEVIQKDVPIYQEFVGQAYGLLDIPIRARVEGFLEEIHFKEGFGVKKGQLLYTIDSQPFQAEVAEKKSKLAEAKTMLVNAQNELARYKPLAKINAVSKSDLDAAQASKDAAESGVNAAEANLELALINLSYTKIKSPINGLIGKTEARVGEFVGKTPNPVILNTVSRIDRIRVQFFLTESQYIILARNYLQEQNIKAEEVRNLELILSDGSIYSEKGKVDFLDRNVDTSTGSLLVQASFPNPNKILRPGMYAKVKVEMEIIKAALLVPQRCVMELQGQYSVYVVDENNTVQSRQVVVGQTIGDLWLINEGLNAGDKVVIDGLQKVGTGVVITPELIEFTSKSN